MGMACSSTWFLIVTLLAWAFVTLVAAMAGPSGLAADERGGPTARTPRKAERRFTVVLLARGPARFDARAPRYLRPYALSAPPDRESAGVTSSA